jgi:drug/metabolite transporter (DMT)-like permease
MSERTSTLVSALSTSKEFLMFQTNETRLSETRWFAIACLLMATCAWGGLFHTGKQALAHLDPFWFTTVRYAGAALLLAGMLAGQHGIQWRKVQGITLRLFGYGMFGYGMFGIMVFLGLSQSVPSHGAVVMATMPLTTLFIRWAFDSQRPQWWAWLAGIGALLGVSLVSGIWSASSIGTSTLKGDAIALIGTLGWIFYTRGQQKVPQLNVMEYTAYTAIMAFPGLLAISVISTLTGHAHAPTVNNLVQVLPVMLYIVIVATVLAALAFNQGVRRLGATNGIVFINFVPVSALAISAVQGNMPSSSELIGTGLVIAALLLLAQRMSAPIGRCQASCRL